VIEIPDDILKLDIPALHPTGGRLLHCVNKILLYKSAEQSLHSIIEVPSLSGVPGEFKLFKQP